MTKGEQTRNRIIQQAAELFNKRGYTGSSINDVMACTGLQKGGIYRHFESKEQLALTAFDYAQRQSTARLEAAVAKRGRRDQAAAGLCRGVSPDHAAPAGAGRLPDYEHDRR